MTNASKHLLRAWVTICAAAIVLPLATGCSSQGQFSDKELQQMKDGPPPEMPAEARKKMEEMSKGQGGTAPPRPKGQPGPGAPM
jgi:hypothetical protein